MKNTGRNFRRIFGITFLTVSVLACKKNDINNSIEDIDNDSSVAIQLSAYEASSVMTKAALKEWNNTELYVFGLKHTADGYDFEDSDNIVNRKAIAESGTYCGLNIYKDEAKEEPYFYRRDYRYDFYGYHLGGAEIVSEQPNTSGDKYSFDLTFDGSNDLMYAVTDKEKDIKLAGYLPEAIGNYGDYVYSERSARMGITPNLVFNHALTRLNFIIKGKGNKYQNVSVTGVEVKSVNKGTLVVTGPEVGFTMNSTAEPVSLLLKAADNSGLATSLVTENTENAVLGGDGACLMIAPGMEEVEIIIYLKNELINKPMDGYKFTAKATDVVKTDESGNKTSVTSFEKGHAYDFYISVYGPEQINISASLAPWVPGGDFTYDPDDYFTGEGVNPNPEPEPTPDPEPDPTPDPEDPEPEKPGNESVGEEEVDVPFIPVPEI